MTIPCAECGTPTEDTEVLDDETGRKLCTRCYLEKKSETETKEIGDQPFDPAAPPRSQAQLLGEIAESSASAAFWAKVAAGVSIAILAAGLAVLVVYLASLKPH